MKTLLIIQLFACFASSITAQILVKEIRIECGNHFFSETDFSQPPLIVRGLFCGNSFHWGPINEGDTITENAYRNGELFTGDCIAKNVNGEIIGKYSFVDSKLTSLMEFDSDCHLKQAFNYEKGIPNGSSTIYLKSGEVYAMRTYQNGILNGPFIEKIGVVDKTVEVSDEDESVAYKYCIEKGEYVNGIRQLKSKPCKNKF